MSGRGVKREDVMGGMGMYSCPCDDQEARASVLAHGTQNQIGLARGLRWQYSIGAVWLIWLLVPRWAWAEVTQEDFLKSVSNHGGEAANPWKMLAVVGGGVLLLGLVFLLSQRQKRKALPTALHHHGKLLKEVCKQVPIRAGDIKRLKTLAEAKGCSSPLTLLLCPSLVQKGGKGK